MFLISGQICLCLGVFSWKEGQFSLEIVTKVDLQDSFKSTLHSISSIQALTFICVKVRLMAACFWFLAETSQKTQLRTTHVKKSISQYKNSSMGPLSSESCCEGHEVSLPFLFCQLQSVGLSSDYCHHDPKLSEF